MGCGDDGKSVDIVQSSLDFGKTDCGATAIPRTLVVSNPSGSALNFTTSLALGDASPYLVVPDSGVVLPSRQLEVTVYSKPVPAISAVTDNLYGDTLTLTTDEAGDSPHAIAITQTARGAVLTLSTDTVAFAPSSLGAATQQLPLTVNNAGNASVAVSFTNDDAFSIAPAGPTMLAAGGSLAATVSHAPGALGTVAADLAIHIDGAVCSAPPMVGATATAALQGAARAIAVSTVRGRPRRTGTPALCVVTGGGFVACTGASDFGMRGQGTGPAPARASYNLVQTATGTLDGVVTLVSGRDYFCARRADNSEWCWGDYLGLGQEAQNDSDRTNPVATNIATDVQAHGAAYANHCAVVAGTMSCSSANEGQRAPVETWTVANATTVTVDNGGGFALLGDGTVMSFGENRAGERGSSVASEAAPSLVSGISNVTQVVAGGNGNALRKSNTHACALESDGSVWCWGCNKKGQLGNGSTNNTSTPTQVMVDSTTPLAAATAITTSGDTACALVAGSVWCWGSNSHGQLGIVTPTDPTYAEQVDATLTGVARLDAGGLTTCAVLTAGGVRCWGLLPDGKFYTTPTTLPVFEP